MTTGGGVCWRAGIELVVRNLRQGSRDAGAALPPTTRPRCRSCRLEVTRVAQTAAPGSCRLRLLTRSSGLGPHPLSPPPNPTGWMDGEGRRMCCIALSSMMADRAQLLEYVANTVALAPSTPAKQESMG